MKTTDVACPACFAVIGEPCKGTKRNSHGDRIWARERAEARVAAKKVRAAIAANALVWRDETSYSRGERGVAEPRVLETYVGTLCISVHRYLHLEDVWYVTCHDVGVSMRALSATDLEAAKHEAVGVVREAVGVVRDQVAAWHARLEQVR